MNIFLDNGLWFPLDILNLIWMHHIPVTHNERNPISIQEIPIQ